jgi:hypothetical protein
LNRELEQSVDAQDLRAGGQIVRGSSGERAKNRWFSGVFRAGTSFAEEWPKQWGR